MLISAIMPTRARPDFAARAVELWQAQTHPYRELVILDDTDAPSFAEPPAIDGVYYERIPRLSLGPKRNVMCSRAQGEVIAFWDDDDWYAPGRLADQAKRLIESGKPLTAYCGVVFVNEDQRKAWKYDSVSFPIGSSLMFRKEFWRLHPFADKGHYEDGRVVQGEDVDFTSPVLGLIAITPAERMMYARNHAGCTDLARRNGIISGDPWRAIEWPEWIPICG